MCVAYTKSSAKACHVVFRAGTCNKGDIVQSTSDSEKKNIPILHMLLYSYVERAQLGDCVRGEVTDLTAVDTCLPVYICMQVWAGSLHDARGSPCQAISIRRRYVSRAASEQEIGIWIAVNV